MPYLVVENGTRRGERVEVPTGGKATFGRDPRAEIAVPDHLCSRRHFEVEEAAGRYILHDLGSSNGTYVNDQRVVGQTDLAHGDCILAGETQLTFLEDAGSGERGLIGKTVGGYRILDRIGRGGMGTVYKANQVSLNRVVALKILSHKTAQDPAFVKRFQKEAQAAGRLNHPNIVQVYDVGSDGGLHFYSMEYIENGSVQDLATREGSLAPDLAVSTILDAARGLEYAEKRGLVHRDIKPDNLMINAEGVVKIADLGLARDAGETARESGAHQGEHHQDDEGIFGTPHFIAPEQAQGRPVDTRSDIYSLGATFYRLLTGQTPFQGDSVREIIYKQIHEQPKPIRELARDCPPALGPIIEKMMRKDPAERYPTASALVEDLERVSAQIESGGRRVVPIAAAVLVLVAVAAVVWWFSRDPSPRPDPGPIVSVPSGPTAEAIEAEKRRQADAERREREQSANEALIRIKFDNVALAGAQRELAKLEALLQRFREIADSPTLQDTEVPAKVRREDIDPLEAEIAALKKAETDRVEAEQRAAAAARAKTDEALAKAEAAAKERRFGAAAAAVAAASTAPELAGPGREADRKLLEDRLAALKAAADARAEQVRTAATESVRTFAFDAAAAALEAEAALISDGAGEASETKPYLELAATMRNDARAALQARDDKIAADKAHDRREVFVVRRRVAEMLAKSFDPGAAKATLDSAMADLRTADGRNALRREFEDIDGMLRVRQAFLDEIKDGVKVPHIRLPSQADPTRFLNYTLLGGDAESVTAKLGQGEPRRFPLAEFRPADLYELVYKGRLPARPDLVADVARLHLASGAPAGAIEILAAGPDDNGAATALRERAERELVAGQKLAEIRAIEKRTEKDPRAWLELLPRIEEFIAGFPDTLLFLMNSNGGATPASPRKLELR